MRDLTSVLETIRPSAQVKYLLVDSSENQLVDACKGVQKEKSAYSQHFSLR